MVMESRIWTILPALVAGIVIGAVVMQILAPPITGTSVPSHRVATATGCLDADDPRGWIGVVREDDHQAVYLMNYSHVHDESDLEIRTNLTETEPNAWQLSLTVEPGDEGKDVPEDCQPRTTIDASVAVPTTAESLTITIDGETIAVVDTSARSPRFYDLDE